MVRTFFDALIRDRERWAIILLWFGALSLALWAYNNSAQLVTALGQTLVAVISFSGAIAVAVLTHVFTQFREQRSQQQKALQENYLEVLGEIGPLIRERAANDKFSSIHLKTLIVGSQDVIEKSKALLEANGDAERTKALQGLLVAMRGDLGLERVEPIPLSPKIFSPQEKGSLVPNTK
jgi:hypothetical protein